MLESVVTCVYLPANDFLRRQNLSRLDDWTDPRQFYTKHIRNRYVQGIVQMFARISDTTCNLKYTFEKNFLHPLIISIRARMVEARKGVWWMAWQ